MPIDDATSRKEKEVVEEEVEKSLMSKFELAKEDEIRKQKEKGFSNAYFTKATCSP